MGSGKQIAWQIQPLVRSGFTQVVELERAIEGPSEVDLRRWMLDRGLLCMVARDSAGELLGWCAYAERQHNFVLQRVAVWPCFRRRGVASSLVEYVAARMRISKDRDRILVEVDEYDLPAQLFLRATGFAAYAIKKRGTGEVIRFDLGKQQVPS